MNNKFYMFSHENDTQVKKNIEQNNSGKKSPNNLIKAQIIGPFVRLRYSYASLVSTFCDYLSWTKMTFDVPFENYR